MRQHVSGGDLDETIFRTHPDLLEMAARSQLYYLGNTMVTAAGVEAAEMYGDALEAARCRNAQLLGGVALQDTVRVAIPDEPPVLSIKDRLQQAAAGSEAARQSLMPDVSTELIEMICKGGAVMEVAAAMNTAGELEQFEQTTFHRQKNTLTYYPNLSQALRANTIAEGQNGFLIESLWQQGELADKKVMEFSLILDNEHRKQLSEYGYYLNEMIGIIRMTDVEASGQATITSALVGGVDQDEIQGLPSGDTIEADEIARQDMALAVRFDMAVVRRMYDLFGYEQAYDMSTTELLATPLLVPKQFDVLDFVQLYDQVAGDLIGKEVFFGLTNLRAEYAEHDTLDREAYAAHARASQERQAHLRQLSEAVLDELLERQAEATDALVTSKLLREIAKNQAVEYLVTSKTADVRVLGTQAEALILQAQAQLAQGNIARVQALTTQAKKVARPSGCPTDSRSTMPGDDDPTLDDGESSKSSEDSGDDKSKWRWKRGVCRVTSCPSRPKTTMIGPCAVCYGCQKKFDSGRDPTTEYVRPRPKPAGTKPRKQLFALAA